jgi:hypothetical protein
MAIQHSIGCQAGCVVQPPRSFHMLLQSDSSMAELFCRATAVLASFVLLTDQRITCFFPSTTQSVGEGLSR